ncbi:diguanylate cyclase, partial [Acinetobacter baumannii]
ERRRAVAERRDPLTGLPNRTALIERLGTLLGDQPPAPGALLVIAFGNYRDLHDDDHRDLLDDLLREVARRLERVIGPDDRLM